MLSFFKTRFGVYLSRDFLVWQLAQVEKVLDATSSEQHCDIHDQVRLFALIHLVLASFYSLTCCRMAAQQLLTAEDLAGF